MWGSILQSLTEPARHPSEVLTVVVKSPYDPLLWHLSDFILCHFYTLPRIFFCNLLSLGFLQTPAHFKRIPSGSFSTLHNLPSFFLFSLQMQKLQRSFPDSPEKQQSVSLSIPFPSPWCLNWQFAHSANTLLFPNSAVKL